MGNCKSVGSEFGQSHTWSTTMVSKFDILKYLFTTIAIFKLIEHGAIIYQNTIKLLIKSYFYNSIFSYT